MTAVETLNRLLSDNCIGERDQHFCASLVTASRSRFGLSRKQAEWVDRMVARYTQPAASLPSMAGVVALLAKAKAAGLKYPKLWLQLSSGEPLRVTVAGPASRAPGELTLSDGGPFGANRYYGRISAAGVLTIGRDGDQVKNALVALLSALAVDPAKVAAEYGHLSGNCCFCARRLDDERSTEVGYGPVCARRFGLSWGAKVPASHADQPIDPEFNDDLEEHRDELQAVTDSFIDWDGVKRDLLEDPHSLGVYPEVA